jgi:hypothetical protein
MNMHKLTFIPVLSIALLFNACGESPKTTEEITNQGNVILENGKGEKDSVSYQCVGCKELVKSKKLFDKIVNEASELTKNGLNFPLSYLPKSMEISIIKEESLVDVENNKKMEDIMQVISEIKYIAKNAYGNELEGESIQSFYLQGEKIVDLADKIKLPKLQFEAGFINRTLSGQEGTEDFIEFTPQKDKSIILKTSLSCVAEGAVFQINLENGEKIELNSWNDFNCDGVSYFHWFSEKQMDMLKTSKLKELFFYSDGEAVMVNIPKNQRDYFSQLFLLY